MSEVVQSVDNLVEGWLDVRYAEGDRSFLELAFAEPGRLAGAQSPRRPEVQLHTIFAILLREGSPIMANELAPVDSFVAINSLHAVLDLVRVADWLAPAIAEAAVIITVPVDVHFFEHDAASVYETLSSAGIAVNEPQLPYYEDGGLPIDARYVITGFPTE